MKEKCKYTMKEIDEFRITEFLNPESRCGETSFPDCTTNRQWITKEVKRLKDGGVKTVIVRHGGKDAIFRAVPGCSARDIERILDDAEKNGNAKAEH